MTRLIFLAGDVTSGRLDGPCPEFDLRAKQRDRPGQLGGRLALIFRQKIGKGRIQRPPRLQCFFDVALHLSWAE
jgi:hypothetical protein